MKFLTSLLTLTLILSIASAQENDIPELETNFSALIVEDLDTSLLWYSKMLGFEAINKNEFQDGGFKQANLKRGDNFMELIELEAALHPKEIATDYNDKTRLIGLFKIGFAVSGFDWFINYLKENNVVFQGDVVINELTGKRMVIIRDPDENRIQLFEN